MSSFGSESHPLYQKKLLKELAESDDDPFFKQCTFRLMVERTGAYS
jgi:hypothetical protein